MIFIFKIKYPIIIQINKSKKIMKKFKSCSDDEKSSSENCSYISSEGMPLNESFDSNQDSKSSKDNKKPKQNKSLSVLIKKRQGKIIRKRKEDNIRKKIKTCAIKAIIKEINKRLIKAGSKHTFKAFPQHFIADISRKTNYEVMQLAFRELFEYTYEKLIKDENYKRKKYNKTLINAAKEKYAKNLETLEYLDSIQEINLKSVWEQIKSIKYVDLLRDFFSSNDFEKSVANLKEDKYYINSYKYFAETFVEFFLSYKPIEENNTGPNVESLSSSSITPNPRANTAGNVNSSNYYPNDINGDVIPNPESNTFIFDADLNFPNFQSGGMIPSSDSDILESLNSFPQDDLIGRIDF